MKKDEKMRMPRRVLMTADAAGGIWTFATELAGALCAAGVEVELAVMGGPISPELKNEALSIPGVRLHESAFRLEWMEDPWRDIEKAGKWLLGIERRVRPDVVHLNGYAHGALDWSCPVLITAHSCVLSWWTAVKGGGIPARWDRYRAEVKNGLASAGLVTAPTRAMLNSLGPNYDFKGSGMVVYNGRSAGAFSPGKKEDIIFTAARLWDEAKNIAALRAASPRIGWPVYAAGECAPGLLNDATDNFHCLGHLSVKDISSWMSRASIYAHPAYYEPFGLSVLEAALSGCALVLGDIESLREVWGGAAVFVPPEDRTALSEALSELGMDPERLRLMARLARSRARRYAPRRMALGYLNAYAALLGARTGAEARCVS